MIFTTKSAKETENLAPKILESALNLNTKKAKVIALEGELGAGKTTLVKGLARGLGINAIIKSPTFVIMRQYPVKKGHLFHFDCYRLNGAEDLSVLGIKDILSNEDNIVVIEWAERVRKILPKKHLQVHIDHISENKRKILVKD